MPAYNAEKYIKQAINSILNQSYTNFEFLIADDGSTDATRTIIDSYTDARIKTFHNAENLGYLKTWNKLIGLAKGNYISFQDADDFSALNRLEILKKHLDNNKELAIVGSNYYQVNEANLVLFTSNFKLKHHEICNEIPNFYNFVGSGILIKKEVLETIGVYNEFFNRIGGEDIYWIALTIEKFKMGNVSESLYFYRFNPNSVMGDLSKDPKKLFMGEFLINIISQRKKTNTDDLAQNKLVEINSFFNEKMNQIGNNEDQILNYVAKRRFYEGHKKIAIKLMIKAIAKNPIQLSYFKDFFYFLRN